VTGFAAWWLASYGYVRDTGRMGVSYLYYVSPSWSTPLAAVIGLVGLSVVAAILLLRRP